MLRRSRRRTRQQRLLRTAIVVVGILGVVAMIGNVVGDDEKKKKEGPLQTPIVAFEVDARGYSDGGKPSGGAVRRETDEITGILNEWYQLAFVDPSQFGTGTFTGVAARFTKAAREAFVKDRDSLTIGRARTEVLRVVPQKAEARISVYFERGRRARFAVADVDFVARATMKPPHVHPLAIDQRAILHLRNTADGWRVVYYSARQSQDSVLPPSPSPTAVAS